ncbi:hypothetical protein ACWGE1_07410 [Streptomyces sp. NPDC054932]
MPLELRRYYEQSPAPTAIRKPGTETAISAVAMDPRGIDDSTPVDCGPDSAPADDPADIDDSAAASGRGPGHGRAARSRPAGFPPATCSPTTTPSTSPPSPTAACIDSAIDRHLTGGRLPPARKVCT